MKRQGNHLSELYFNGKPGASRRVLFSPASLGVISAKSAAQALLFPPRNVVERQILHNFSPTRYILAQVLQNREDIAVRLPLRFRGITAQVAASGCESRGHEM
jgi:hypothetical protein